MQKSLVASSTRKEKTRPGFLGSSLLSFCLLTLLTASVSVIYKKYAPPYVGNVAGHETATKSNTLVVHYRPDCGCNRHLFDWATKAMKQKRPLLVLAGQKTPEILALQNNYPASGVTVEYVTDTKSLDTLSPTHRTTLNRISMGFVVAQSSEDNAYESVVRP